MVKKFLFILLLLLHFSCFYGQNPQITFSSSSPKNLYLQCENTILLDIGELCGEDCIPNLVASNAEVKQELAGKYAFKIFPKKGKKCLLTLYNQKSTDSIKIGEKTILIFEPLKPHLFASVNGVSYHSDMPITKGNRLTFEIKPNFEFEKKMPKEAVYGLSEVRIVIGSCQGARVISSLKEVNFLGKKAEIFLPETLFLVPENKFFVEVVSVYRINSRGEKVIDTRFSMEQLAFSFIGKNTPTPFKN